MQSGYAALLTISLPPFGRSVLMVTGITIAGRVPSELIRMNYDSIAYAQEMVRAMNGIRFPELYRDTDTLGWEKRFGDTLEQASGSITEEAGGRSLRIFKPHGMRTARLRTTPITGACTPASTPWFRSTSEACSCGSARTPGSATS